MSSVTPWKDERWMPGVLNKRQMLSLIGANYIRYSDGIIKWDASALDLHLSSEGYRMKMGSIKPFNKNYSQIISDPEFAIAIQKEEDGSFLLNKGICYLFKIKESLNPCIRRTPIYGQATAKSTVGRVDVIARLIVDGMKEYEKFNPEEVDSGDMFIEITSITFNIKVREGDSLSQLRFFYGKIENSIITDTNFINSILQIKEPEFNSGTLSVNIYNETLNNNISVAAFQAKKTNNESLELWTNKKYSPNDFWIPVPSSESHRLKNIVIDKDEFYILRSYERINLNENACIYCRAMDETLGEMRIHYAGFVHPCFGQDRTKGPDGTPLIFEVRGHNVSILLTDKEILARLFFYNMSEKVDKSEKPDDNPADGYNDQELKLSNIFQVAWP